MPRELQPKRAVRLNGLGQSIELPDDIGISGAQNRTLCAWVNLDSSSTGSILSLGLNSPGTRFTLRPNSGVLRVEIQGGGYSSSLTLSTTQWQFVAVTLDGTTLGDCTLWVDDQFENCSGSNAINTDTTDIVLGQVNGLFLDGLMFDARIYDRALSSNELEFVRTFGDSGTDPTTSNLLAHYKLDDNSTTQSLDSSGNGNAGTNVGFDSNSLYEGEDVPFSWQNEVGYSDGINWFEESESFANWGKLRAGVTSQATAAPDGSLTADEIVQQVGQANGGLVRKNPLVSGVVNVSVYAKTNGKRYLIIDTGSNSRTFFDLQNGTLATVSTNHSAVVMTDEENGWYRCSLSVESVSSEVFFRMGDVDGSLANTSDASLYLWGPQVSESDTVLPVQRASAATVGSYIPIVTGSSPPIDALGNTPDYVGRFGANPLLLKKKRLHYASR